jgi:anti-sigma28 factor (negative regulator of flagellin synthesis)
MAGDHFGNDAPPGSSGDPADTDIWRVTMPSPEERSMRIDQIRREIEEGRYRVSGEAVADAILAFYSRGP